MDPKDLAGATVWLFVEGNFNVVRSYGTTGKDEISVWTREDSSEFARKTEAKVIPMKHDEIFLLS